MNTYLYTRIYGLKGMYYLVLFLRSLLSTICLAKKYKDKLYNVCYDPTRDRTHEYLSRNLIDNSFEFY
jgi:hypothetical protein